jgi:hypothetical protein
VSQQQSGPQKVDPIRGIITVVLLAGGMWLFLGGGFTHRSATNMGSMVNACVNTDLVGAAYVQANDEPNFKRWTAAEESGCLPADFGRGELQDSPVAH